MTRVTRFVIAATCLTFAGLLVGNALANTKPPKPPTDVPAISEYIEPNPTLGGPTDGAPTNVVTPKVAKAIAKAGGTDAAALTNIASSMPHVKRATATIRAKVGSSNGSASALGAAVQSAGVSSVDAVLLGAALVLVSVAFGAAVARRRGQSAVRE